MRWRLLVLMFGAFLSMTGAVWAQPVTQGTAGDGGTSLALPTATSSGDGGSVIPFIPPPTVPFEDGGTLTGEQYVVRLRDLEQRINALKEEIFRSKARLSLLAESVLQNTVGGSRAVIVHQNEMGATYRLINVVYSLDGAPILNRQDDNGSLADQRQFNVYAGQVGSGDHTLGVSLTYLGAGLPYMKGYQFRARSTQSFSVPEGKAVMIRVVAYERGGPLEPPENRPTVRYVQRVMSLRDAVDLAGENGGSGASSDTAPAAPSSGATSGNTAP
jgi:hypothetical protein